MRQLTTTEIGILQRHSMWLRNEEGGERANLRGADLRGANLRGADLRDANLYGANLRGADLRGTDLRDANLYDARNVLAFGPIGSRGGSTYAVNHKDGIMIKCGCFWGTMNEWVVRCKSEHGESEHGLAYAAAEQFIKAYADAYNWSTARKDGAT